jgi:hypothetical protein
MDRGPVWVPYLLVTAEWFLSYYVAKLSYHFFERYFLNFKDRFAAHIPAKEMSVTV